MNSHVPPAQEHGYVPHGPLYFTHDAHNQPAPPGYAFNVRGELVQLSYETWAEGPQLPWESPENPDYVEYAAGRASIEQQPSADPRLPIRYSRDRSESVGHVAPLTHSDVALVPQREYLERDGDTVPQRDMGTGSQAVFDTPASIARTRYILSKPIIGYVEVESPVPGQLSPLTVVPSGNAEGGGGAVAPFGGAVALANFSFGHLGSQIANITADVLPGSLTRITTASSFMNAKGRLSPRYFAKSDAGVIPNITRTYLLFPGGPPLTNDNFTDLPDNIMSLQGVGPGTLVAAGAQAIPVQYFGWCGLGYVESPLLESVPTRVFRGTVPSAAPGAAFTNNALCPIPKGTVSVRLVGGFFNPADTPQAVTVQFTQILDWGGAVTGPFPPNAAPIPILEGTVAIGVQASSSAAGGSVEVPFALYYYFDI